jgi:hypothetical protein
MHSPLSPINKVLVLMCSTIKSVLEQAKEGEGERWIALMSQLTEGASDGTIASFPTDATTHLQIKTHDFLH